MPAQPLHEGHDDIPVIQDPVAELAKLLTPGFLGVFSRALKEAEIKHYFELTLDQLGETVPEPNRRSTQAYSVQALLQDLITQGGAFAVKSSVINNDVTDPLTNVAAALVGTVASAWSESDIDAVASSYATESSKQLIQRSLEVSNCDPVTSCRVVVTPSSIPNEVATITVTNTNHLPSVLIVRDFDAKEVKRSV